MDAWQKFKSAKMKELKEHEKSGKADMEIMELVHEINSAPNLVTTSSCAGRINLVEYDLEQGKKTANFHKKWHRTVTGEEVELALCDYTEKNPLWFKVEPFILHVAAKDVTAAVLFLKLVRAVGVKRGGIQTIGKDKVMIEIQGNGVMVIPVEPVNGEWGKIVAIANEMMKKNFEVVKKLGDLPWNLERKRTKNKK
jgi:tRNA(Phe) wybutosine-synthesizing methylase Tyw3